MGSNPIPLYFITHMPRKEKTTMARERMVTRTIEANRVTVMCLDTITAEPQNETVEISAAIKGDKAMLKAIRKLIETEDYKVVKIVAESPVKALYKMSEAEFIANATKEIIE